MDVDLVVGALATLLATAIGIFVRRGLAGLRDFLIDVTAAAVERSRRRDRKQSTPPRLYLPQEIPIEVEPETTDIHALIDLERADRKARAKSKVTEQRQALGARPPRPGTHHDREQ